MSYIGSAQARARRRKSFWNLLLPLFIVPIFASLSWTSFKLAWWLNITVYPSHVGRFEEFWNKGISFISLVSSMLMMFGPVVPNLIASMIVGNYLVWVIPPARRALDREARPHPGTDFRSTQRSFLRYLPMLVAIGYGLSALGAVTLVRLHR